MAAFLNFIHRIRLSALTETAYFIGLTAQEFPESILYNRQPT
jgi:hypothetical protein